MVNPLFGFMLPLSNYAFVGQEKSLSFCVFKVFSWDSVTKGRLTRQNKFINIYLICMGATQGCVTQTARIWASVTSFKNNINTFQRSNKTKEKALVFKGGKLWDGNYKQDEGRSEPVGKVCGAVLWCHLWTGKDRRWWLTSAQIDVLLLGKLGG